MRHLNDLLKALIDLRWTNHLHKFSKIKGPKNGSFQLFLESKSRMNQRKFDDISIVLGRFFHQKVPLNRLYD